MSLPRRFRPTANTIPVTPGADAVRYSGIHLLLFFSRRSPRLPIAICSITAKSPALVDRGVPGGVAERRGVSEVRFSIYPTVPPMVGRVCRILSRPVEIALLSFAINIVAFNYYAPVASGLFRNRINFERFDKGGRGVRQTIRNKTIHQRFSISEIEHYPGFPLTAVFF
jgi:hypothetical protein